MTTESTAVLKYPVQEQIELLEAESKYLQAAREKLLKNKSKPRVNLPALARRDSRFMECWQSDPGRIFISSDFTSLEPSITAHFSQDPNYKYATYDGIGKLPYINDQNILMIDDIYLMTASVMPGLKDSVLEFFSNPELAKKWLEDSEWCKEHPLLKAPRKQAKPACLGFGYGMGPKRFVNQCYDVGISITQSQAKAMYQAYWELFGGIQTLALKLQKLMEQNQYLVNPFGYRLTTEPHKSYNAMVQSSASGVVDVFCLKFFSKCADAIFIALIHDEVVYHINEKKISETKKLQDEAVMELNEILQFSIPMRLGFVEAKTFADIK